MKRLFIAATSLALTISALNAQTPAPAYPGPGQPPSLVPLGFFAMIAIIVWLSLAARGRKRQLAHDTMRLMIEKGQPVPPELFLDPKISARPPNDLRRGVVLIATGIGIAGFFLTSHNHAWGLGLIPLLVGVGYLIIWKIQGSHENNGAPS